MGRLAKSEKGGVIAYLCSVLSITFSNSRKKGLFLSSERHIISCTARYPMLPTYTAQNEFSPKRKFLTSQIVLQYSLLYGKSQKGQRFYAGEVIADR